jgi:hypothetical protein
MCVKEIYRFRFDEDKIWIYKCKKSLPFDIKETPQCPSDAPCYSHESLPAEYWPMYLNACQFMTINRKKIPKITIYIDDAKAVLYDSSGFFQVLFFAQLTKVIFGNGIQIVKATGIVIFTTKPRFQRYYFNCFFLGEVFNVAYINSDTIPENLKPLLYRASELYDLARDYEKAEKSFPIVKGEKSYNQTQQKQMDRIVPDFTSFSIMIGHKPKIPTNQIVPGFPTFS